MEVPATKKPLEQSKDPGGQWAVALPEAVVPDAEELLHSIFNNLLEVVGRGTGMVAGDGGRREVGQAGNLGGRRHRHRAAGNGRQGGSEYAGESVQARTFSLLR
jgi:hypothetical protein